MQLLSADAHLGSEPELPSVGEAGGGIPIHGGGVHQAEKALSIALVARDYRF